MKYVEVVADAGHVDTVSAIAEQFEVCDFRLACNIVYLTKGVSPRTWWKKEKAKKRMRTYMIMLVVTLVI